MVEWKKLGDCCKTISPPKKLEKELYGDEGLYPIIDQGQKDIVGYTDDASALVPTGEYVLFGDHTRYVKYHKGSFAQGADGLKILVTKESIIPRYFFYTLANTDVPSRGYSRHWSIAKVIEIPLPSLSEQERIVGILDTFTSSIENLKAQISLRRKQYEHYRDKLLDLEGKEGVEMKTLGDLLVFKNGLNKEKKFFGQGTPIVNYTDVYHNNRLHKETLKGLVTLSEGEIERYRVQRGDVFFTRTSETPEEVGIASVILDDIKDCTFSGFLLRARPITTLLLPEYCAYCFGSYNVRQAIIKYSTFTTRALTNGTSLSRISIPLPSLEEQSRIVSILDEFEASIKNLEAQLEAREKQYEYYREKLLTFERE